MSKTIAGTVSSLVTLSSTASDNPATIVSGAVLRAGLYGESNAAWTLTNYGIVNNTGTNFAITLGAGGTISNKSAGTISSGAGVEFLGAAGSLVNAGLIVGTTGNGVNLAVGGSVTNQAAGSIGGYRYGVYAAASASGTVLNYGSISGTGTAGKAVRLAHGGLVSNAAGGVLSGGLYGVWFTGTAATLRNSGSISGGAYGVDVKKGGAITNALGGVISGGQGLYLGGSATLSNYGTIGGSQQDGVYANVSVLTNQSSGQISGISAGVSLFAAALTNRGSIDGTIGVDLGVSGTLLNQGVVSGTKYGASGLGIGDYVINQAGGTIIGARGVYIAHYGTTAQTSTVSNSGSIVGTAGTAVAFAAGVSGRVVVNPGATFIGTVSGGNTIGSATVSTLDLASAASAATLSGLGTQFTRFGNIIIDAGARWTFASENIGSGYTIVDAGTMSNAGTLGSPVTLNAGAVLSNLSTGHITSGNTTVIYGTGAGPATLVNAGLIKNTAQGPGQYGVLLAVGGTVTNQSGGTINGYNAIVASAAAAGTVLNYGSISGGIHGPAIFLKDGGFVSNATGGVISSGTYSVWITKAAGTVLNAGTIAGGVFGEGVYLKNGGSINNASSATISGLTGVRLNNPATVVNAGSIAGYIAGIFANSGYATNQASGRITSGTIGVAMGLGTFTNLGTVSGQAGVELIQGATLLNQGLISGTQYGVTAIQGSYVTVTAVPTFVFGSYVTNESGGTIIGAVGAEIGSRTMFNAGTIIGTAGTAVAFSAGLSNRLILQAGAAFTGAVDGGNTIGSTKVSTLELASGASAGTLTSLGTGIVHFANITVDSGAAWTLASDTLASGYTITDNGTLTNAGTLSSPVTLGAGAVLSNVSGGTIKATGTAVYGVASGAATAINAGFISASSKGVYLRDGGLFNNQSGGTIAGYFAVYAKSASATAINAGLLTASGSGLAVMLGDGGLVTNQAGGTITGLNGVRVLQVAGTVDNAGLIASTDANAGKGVDLRVGGTITNQAGGTISAFKAVAVASGALTLANSGLISGSTQGGGAYPVTDGVGVYAGAGGSIVNLSGGTISGYVGVNIGGFPGHNPTGTSGGTFVNQAGALISGIRWGVYAILPVTLTNAGTISAPSQQAVQFAAGFTDRLIVDPGAVFDGKVDGGNTIGSTKVSTLELASGASAGTLTSLGTGIVHFANITVDSGAAWTLASDTLASGYTITDNGTLTNAGTLSSPVTLGAGAVLSNVSGGTIKATGTAVYGVASGAATAINAGFISASSKGVYLRDGGLFNNQSGGTIAGYFAIYAKSASATAINAGLLTASGSGLAVMLGDGGLVTNQAGGTITGLNGVRVLQVAGTVDNAGLIASTDANAGKGVDLRVGGTITNQAAGTISAFQAVAVASGAFTLANSGLIAGSTQGGGAYPVTDGVGVYAGAGGSIVNLSGGTISGYVGVNIGGFPGHNPTGTSGGTFVNQAGALISGIRWGVYAILPVTLTNAGTISAPSQQAVQFAAGFTDRLIVDPGAVFDGKVDGGNTIGAAHTSTLELASSASAGTLTSLGTGIVHFANITVDSAAAWTLASDTLASGYTITDNGTLTNAGTLSSPVTLGAGAVLSNVSGGTIKATGTAVYGVASGAATAINAGFISASSDGVYLADGGLVSNQTGGTITGAFAVYAKSASATAINAGLLTASTGMGIFLNEGGVVTNQTGGTIVGLNGVRANLAAGTVINAGSIASNNGTSTGEGIYLNQGGAVTNLLGGTITGRQAVYAKSASLSLTNAGIIAGATLGGSSGIIGDGIGVQASKGGQVVNASGGTISGYAGVYLIDTISGTIVNQAGGLITGSDWGIYILGLGTVTNAGTISAPSHEAVGFSAGNADRLIVDPGAVFVGKVDGGNTVGATAVSTLELASGASTGTLAALGSGVVHFTSVTIDSGASWALTNASVAAGYTLANGGTIVSGVTMAGGVLTNAVTAAMIASGMAAIYDGGGTLLNSGLISDGNTSGATGVLVTQASAITNQASGTVSSSQYGVYVSTAAGATVVNYGTIVGTGSAAKGVRAAGGGVVSNAAGGFISGGSYGVWFTSTAAQLVNAGSISGGQAGVYLKRGGTVINRAGATISGRYGVLSKNAAVTLIDAGSISGSSAAVVLHGGLYANRLVLYPGATFSGNVNGGNAAGGGFAVSTLELASAASAGTLTSFGSRYVDFSNIIVDTAAQWTLAADQIGSQYTITDDGTLTNAGSIGSPLTLGAGAQFTNIAGGTIAASGTAIVASGGAAGNIIVDGGRISGSSTAILFGGGGANRLVLDPGSSITGAVDGGNTIGSTAVSTLELASSASAGTLGGLGTQFVNFQNVTIDSGATWTFSGNNTLESGVTLFSAGSITNTGTLTLLGAALIDSGTLVNNGSILADPSTLTLGGLIGSGVVDLGSDDTLTVNGTVASTATIVFASGTSTLNLDLRNGLFAGTVQGFTVGDRIGLLGITDATGANLVNGDTLAVTSTSQGIIDLNVTLLGPPNGTSFVVTPQSAESLITATDVACFAAGTGIDTPAGPVAVESLCAGDRVLTASGALRHVRWIGMRRLDLRRLAQPEHAQPIRIAAHAIADGAPRRDLWLSPDHALFLDGKLIAARQLLNGATIRRESVAAVTYYHVELDTHDVLLAEGMAAESYLDTGNRDMFENNDGIVALHPAFGINDQARREAESCAPFVDAAAAVEPVWQRLAARARDLGYVLPAPPHTEEDPELCVLLENRRIKPMVAERGRYVFALPTIAREVRLHSRWAVPSELRPWLEDRRRLGVMVRRVTLRCGAEWQAIPLDDPALRDGWWAVEHDRHALWRWTKGDAILSVQTSEPCLLEVELAETLPYPADKPAIAA